MKKMQSLGKILCKEEQRKITGGAQVTCTCNDRYTMGIVCSYSGFGGAIVCSASALKACQSAGGNTITCNYR